MLVDELKRLEKTLNSIQTSFSFSHKQLLESGAYNAYFEELQKHILNHAQSLSLLTSCNYDSSRLEGIISTEISEFEIQKEINYVLSKIEESQLDLTSYSPSQSL